MTRPRSAVATAPGPAGAARPASCWQLRLVHRESGLPLCLGGAEYTVLARDPVLAAAEMMEHRSAALWQVRARPA